jgi:MFS family permease
MSEQPKNSVSDKPSQWGGFGILFLSVILYWLSFSMVGPITVLYFSSQAYPPAIVGFFLALGSVIPLLFAMPAGGFIDRIGTRKSVLIGAAICTASGFMYIVGGSKNILLLFLAGQIINGFGALLTWGALQASAAIEANKLKSSGKGDHILSNFSFVNSLAQLSGPVVGGILSDKGGYITVFSVYAILSAFAFGIAFFLPKTAGKADGTAVEEKRNDVNRQFWKSYVNGISLMKNNKSFFVAIVLNGILFILVDIRGTFLPVYLASGGLSNTQVGGLLSISGVAAVIIRPFVGSLLKFVGHHWMMVICIVSGGLCMAGFSLKPAVWIMAVIIFVWGVCTGINQPMALIMVANTVRPHEQGMGMSIRTMANRSVQVINPIVVGALSGIFGLSIGFGIIGVILVLAGTAYHFKRTSTGLPEGHA